MNKEATQCSSVDEWINKIRSVHTMEDCVCVLSRGIIKIIPGIFPAPVNFH